jgi:hypothetical protein
MAGASVTWGLMTGVISGVAMLLLFALGPVRKLP